PETDRTPHPPEKSEELALRASSTTLTNSVSAIWIPENILDLNLSSSLTHSALIVAQPCSP
ncbi:MAG: hypothetical protein WA414_15985, partial [Acidobacteriaceae bacterium]